MAASQPAPTGMDDEAELLEGRGGKEVGGYPRRVLCRMRAAPATEAKGKALRSFDQAPDSSGV